MGVLEACRLEWFDCLSWGVVGKGDSTIAAGAGKRDEGDPNFLGVLCWRNKAT